MNEIRLRRVERLIREMVSTLILGDVIKDPRVDASLTVTRVKVAKDLVSARLWVSSLKGRGATERAVRGLASAAGFIQSVLGRRLKLRHTPKLFFSPDDSIREALSINRLIDETVAREQSADDGPDPS